MKNYIANEQGGWATSVGYIKYSFSRSIHFGRLYTHGNQKGRDEDLCEAMRCLGQGLHTMEDFGAHSNYCELALRELGFHNVFPHTGTNTMMNIQGKHVFPCVTGTFGGVDFLHSVLGEATDHFTQSDVSQSEIDKLDATLGNASSSSKKSVNGENSCDQLTSLLSKVPGTSSLCQEAQSLQRMSDEQASMNYRSDPTGGQDQYNMSRADGPQQPPQFSAPPGSVGGPPGPGIPGVTNMDPTTIVPKIYPILQFRDKVVRSISAVVSKIPGLEALIDNITEKVTLFIFSLLAPFVRPLIAAASNSLKTGSSGVIAASQKAQYEPWNNPNCTDPTHSLLSKDHFSNILNEPAGKVAAAILQYVAPRVIYAWDHPDVPVDQVLNDISAIFHHPALRHMNNECHRNMFQIMERWVHERKGQDLNVMLSSESVKAGKNHVTTNLQESLEPGIAMLQQPNPHGHSLMGSAAHGGPTGGSGSNPLSSFLGKVERKVAGGGSSNNPLSSFLGGGGHGGSSSNSLASFLGSGGQGSSPFSAFSMKRDIDDFASDSGPPEGYNYGAGSVAGAPYEPPYSQEPYQGASFGGQPQVYGQQQPQGQDPHAYQGGYQQQQVPPGDYGNWNPNASGPYGQTGGGYGGGY